jgi:hypothetical protein
MQKKNRGIDEIVLMNDLAIYIFFNVTDGLSFFITIKSYLIIIALDDI